MDYTDDGDIYIYIYIYILNLARLDYLRSAPAMREAYVFGGACLCICLCVCAFKNSHLSAL